MEGMIHYCPSCTYTGEAKQASLKADRVQNLFDKTIPYLATLYQNLRGRSAQLTCSMCGNEHLLDYQSDDAQMAIASNARLALSKRGDRFMPKRHIATHPEAIIVNPSRPMDKAA